MGGVIAHLFRPRGWQKDYHETGSDAEIAWNADLVDKGKRGGKSIPEFIGYGVNPARNNGADLEPIPITPVRGQNWPGMQIQLRNGWETTAMGKRLTYDDYLRMLTAHLPNQEYLIPSRSGNLQKGAGPAPSNVQSMINVTSGAQQQTPGGPGFIAPGVDLSSRMGYYG